MNNGNIDEQATYWYACNKEGLLYREKKVFDAWIKENPKHKEAFEKIQKIEKICNSFDDEYRNSLTKDILNSTKSTKTTEKFKYFSAAAVFILAISTGIFKVYDTYIPNYENSLITQTEIIKSFSLPDGSILALDAKTNIKMKFYNDERKIDLLEGQVMFDIAKDQNRPFKIKSNAIEIEVLGTSFEVRNKNKETQVKVAHGTVKVSYINGTSNMPRLISLLNKGDELKVNDFGKILVLKSTVVDNIALWQNNRIFFDNVSLKEAVLELSKYIKNEIKIQDEISSLNITGRFFTNKPGKFFEAITSIYPIEISEKNNLIQISKTQ